MNGDDVIFVSSRGVVRANIDPAADAAEIAQTVTGALAGCSGEIVVAIPSAWCLTARVESSANARDDHKTLLFRLEEKLPLAAEQIVADFIPQEHSGRPTHALGVAARLDVLRPLIAAVEAAGLIVRSVSPLALLAAQQFAADDPGDAIELWTEGGQVNVIARRGRRTAVWSLVAGDDSDAVRRETDVQCMAFDRPPRVEQRGQVEASAATAARSILAGRTRPCVELRRDALTAADRIRSHRRPLNLALAAAALLLILLTGAMLVRAVRYERLVTTYERQLADEFSRAFPDWSPPPANVRAVIDSEFRKAQAQRTGAGLNTSQTSALRTLHDVLSRFPVQARCDVDQLTFGDGSFELQGRVHALEDVESLASAAREAGLEVPPPVTRRGEDGLWAVTLRGARPQPGVAVAGEP